MVAILPHEGTFNILYGPLAIPAGSSQGSGYMARPDRVGRFPVVMILPGIFGLTSFEKDLCRRFARRGYATIALDLYRGSAPDSHASIDEAIVAYQALEDARVVTDISDAHAFVAGGDLDWVLDASIGLVGYDTGGRFGLLYAQGRHDVGAVVAVSAPLGGDEHRGMEARDALNKIGSPMLGLYGSADELISSESVDVAQALNPSGTWILYEGARHGFLNDGTDEFHPGAASDAMARIPAFLASHLAAPAPAAY